MIGNMDSNGNYQVQNNLSAREDSMVEYMDSMKEKRTGITAYNQGLDANSLNKTATGVAQIMNASQQRIELVARTFAETGVKELFKLVHYLVRTTLTKPDIIRLRNKWVEVDTAQTVSSTPITFTASDRDLNNATVRGVFVKLNPNSPITKSPYVSNCSAFSTGGVGAVVDGKVHKQYDNTPQRSNKSIVFDSWTNMKMLLCYFMILSLAVLSLTLIVSGLIPIEYFIHP